jgi:hypothetical protein
LIKWYPGPAAKPDVTSNKVTSVPQTVAEQNCFKRFICISLDLKVIA